MQPAALPGHRTAPSQMSSASSRPSSWYGPHTRCGAHLPSLEHRLPAEPTAWDDGVCGPLVAHLLFGLRDHPMADADPGNPLWQAQLIIRCGNTRGVPGQRASDFCHDTAHAHYTHPLTVEDLRFGETHDTANKATNTTDTVHGMEEYAMWKTMTRRRCRPTGRSRRRRWSKTKRWTRQTRHPAAFKEGAPAAIPIIYAVRGVAGLDPTALRQSNGRRAESWATPETAPHHRAAAWAT